MFTGADNYLENSHLDKPRVLSPAIIMKEPNTALTKNTTFSFNTQAFTSVIQHNRHQSQGPMRSEKVYLMTQMIQQKIEQLASEKIHIKQGYQAIDNRNDSIKN